MNAVSRRKQDVEVPRDIAGLCGALEIETPAHIGDGLFSVVATITPAAASLILEKHHVENNRSIRHYGLSKYASDIGDGNWTLTHQAIAFNDKCRLCDGQHRLLACIDSSHSFRTIVMFGVPSKAMLNIDSGQKRMLSDAMKISGRERISTRDTAVATCIAFGPVYRPISFSQTLHCRNAIRHSLDFINSNFPSSIPGITCRGVLGAIGRAYYHVDEARLTEFCAALRDGALANRDEDRAALLVTRAFAGKRGQGGQTFQCDAYFKTEAAILAFSERRRIERLHRATKELFELPSKLYKIIHG